ncbi:MAG: hypothetical protein ACHQNT_07385 [Bacteroidia bacterium]
MKKTLLIAFCAGMFITTAIAQPFKQTGGECNLQLLFTPFGNTPIDLNNGIMFRKFNSDGTSAWRIGFSIGSSSSTDVLVQAADTGDSAPLSSYPLTTDYGQYTVTTGVNPQADEVSKSFSFTLRPGYEKHYTGTDRLSPYWGGEFVFTKSSWSSETDNIREGNYTAVYTDTTSVNPVVAAPWTVHTTTEKGGSTTFGINLIAGFDFYFAKNLSLGAELSFGWSSTSYSDVESEYVDLTSTTTSAGSFPQTHTVTSTHAVKSSPDQAQGSSSGFGPDVVGQIKLGWLFGGGAK